MSTTIKGGNNSPGLANVDENQKLEVSLQKLVSGNENKVGAMKFYSENDEGLQTGAPHLSSPETDSDYRLRVASDIILDNEIFNYTAQNTGKHNYTNATLAAALTTAGLTTNSGNVTTTTVGLTYGTYAEFPVLGSNTTYAEFGAGFSVQPVANATIDFGLFRKGVTTQFAPLDGVYFRLNASGLFGVINNNGSETVVSFTTPFVYTNFRKYQFIIAVSQRLIEFWINGELYGSIDTPAGQGQPFMSATLPISIRHGHSGVAGGVINFVVNTYAISVGGSGIIRSLGEIGNASNGAYQGLSGGTMGQLISGTVTTGSLVKPTGVVPSNTALTAGLGNSLGGRSWETFTTPLATNVDGIICMYLNPLGTVSVQGKRLRVTGVKLSAVIQAAITGGPFTQEWYMVFGGTAISLQTAETATTKAPRRIMLPEFTQNILITQAANTIVQQPYIAATFNNPIFINPGEYVGLVNNWFGTAPTAGVIAYTYQFDYSWE